MGDRLTDEQVANITRRRFTNDPMGNFAVALAREAQASRKLVAELLAMHRNHDGQVALSWCDHDGYEFPCPTVRLITEACNG